MPSDKKPLPVMYRQIFYNALLYHRDRIRSYCFLHRTNPNPEFRRSVLRTARAEAAEARTFYQELKRTHQS